jgi:5-oxoprolinase (ATP-hydrolysing) subunit A
MLHMDLNADVGEGGRRDAALISLVSSANIACGGHAGDELSMRTAIDACLAAGVAIGAHPGYGDRENFGRRELDLAPATVSDSVARQVSRMVEMTARAGGAMHHVKPHGALYLQADRDPALAAAVVKGVKRIIPDCRFYVPSAGCLAAAGQDAGLMVRAEGFMDRCYAENGQLVSRSQPDAVIEDVDSAVSQALEIALKCQVRTVTGTHVVMPAETLCVHGDSARAVEILNAVRQALTAAGFVIRA